MLDNNTNKLIWVGVAVGIVAILAIGVMTLFPQALSSVGNAMTSISLYSSALPDKLYLDGDEVLTKANRYESIWKYLEFPLNFQNDKKMNVPSHKWVLYDFWFKSDTAGDVIVDINNRIDGQPGNDQDLVGGYSRNIRIWDESGHSVNYSDVEAVSGYVANYSAGTGKIEANKYYHVVIKYKNNNPKPIYEATGMAGTNFGVRPTTGITDNTKIHIQLFNFRRNVL